MKSLFEMFGVYGYAIAFLAGAAISIMILIAVALSV